jgi:hypothetical protein
MVAAGVVKWLAPLPGLPDVENETLSLFDTHLQAVYNPVDCSEGHGVQGSAERLGCAPRMVEPKLDRSIAPWPREVPP